MLADAAWIVLHGGHNDGGVLSFQVVLGGLVTLLVVVGVLWYLGVFESVAGGGDEPDPGSEVGD